MNNAVSSLNFDNITDDKIGSTVLVADIKDVWGSNNGVGVTGNPQVRGDSNCVSGKCIEFNGSQTCDPVYPCTGDSIKINQLNYPEGDNPITLEVWFKLKEGNTNNSIVILGKNWFDPTGLILRSEKINFVVYDNSATARYFSYDAKKVTVGNWNHIVGSYKSQEVKVCLNGDCQKYSTTYIPRTQPTYRVIMGALDSNYDHLRGFIDDARIYAASLTVSQIKSNYLSGLNTLIANKRITKQEYQQRLAELNKDYAKNK
jgi:hypothetical protein